MKHSFSTIHSVQETWEITITAQITHDSSSLPFSFLSLTSFFFVYLLLFSKMLSLTGRGIIVLQIDLC